LCELDISKIWFTFPEPPVSPKGKRKIPYSRHEWNLLSSVSPAVTSWLCACQHIAEPFRIYFETVAYNEIKILAALVSGSLKHKDEFIGSIKIPYLNQQYLKAEALDHLKNPNCGLVKILRLYLYEYYHDIEQDLNLKSVPDIKCLKRGIEEMLICWSSNIQPRMNDHVNQLNILNSNLFGKKKSIAKLGLDDLKAFEQSHSQQQKYRYITEIRQVDQPNLSASSLVLGMLRSLFACQFVRKQNFLLLTKTMWTVTLTVKRYLRQAQLIIEKT
jgi:hypothetical protein